VLKKPAAPVIKMIESSRVLITGASQGIGRALAEQAATRGAVVLAASRSLDLLQQLQQEIRRRGQTLEIVQADVTRADDRQRLLDEVLRRWGGLDILINNAGTGATGYFVDNSPDLLRSIMEVNFFALTEMTRLFLPLLKKGTHPAIVNISSILGKRALPGRGEYCASKFAVQGFSEALRAELAKDGVNVLVVCPGLTRTNFGRNLLARATRWQADHGSGMAPEVVAKATLRALERRKNEICLTAKGRFLERLNRFVPRIVDWIAARSVKQVRH
jgi:short-subunit dehydrogenase